jgi:hypothetical protein
MHDFKVGDKVVLIHPVNVHTLELNKLYTVSEIYHSTYTNNIMIKLEEQDDDSWRYNCKRFILGTKIIRKNKLKQIFKNSKL